MGVSILGVHAGHDAAVCLLQDGKITAMIEEERLTRVKNALPNSVLDLWSQFGGKFGYFPWASLNYCLSSAGLGIDELDAIVLPHELVDRSDILDILPLKDLSKIILSREPIGGAHHYRHALSAFFASPFDDAAVLVVDGDGSVNSEGYEAETGYAFRNRSGDWEQIFKNRYPSHQVLNSGIGWTYDYISSILGFIADVGYLGEPGKTMGLAPLGKLCDELQEPWIVANGFNLDFSGFQTWLNDCGHLARIDFLSKDRALIQNANVNISSDACNIAWKVQNELEQAMLHLAINLRKSTSSKNLCLAGGVALNSVANGKIFRESGFENVFIQPASNDAGQAIGLSYYGQMVLSKRGLKSSTINIEPITHACGGKFYKNSQVEELLNRSGLAYEKFDTGNLTAHSAASALSNGEVIGWFQGASEYGPRALGNRSILADPRGPNVKDQVNFRVKFREPFRPFAPSVLRDYCAEIFELDGDSPFMLLVAKVREGWKASIPAVTHVDGTARVQTVTKAEHGLYHDLISHFYSLTKVPLVLNTSFNLKGMPLVESPEDALSCFLRTDLDALYIGQYRLNAPDLSKVRVVYSKDWELVCGKRTGVDGGLLAYFENRDSLEKQIIEIEPRTGVMFRTCEHLVAAKSVQHAIELATGSTDNTLKIMDEVYKGIQELVRKGVLQLFAGNFKA